MTTHTATTGGAFAHGSFIPSIEGLRALAVLAVLLFHLDIPGIAGGFLGVDLFFVISGFIISRNILTDLQGGTFSLKVLTCVDFADYFRLFWRRYYSP